MYKRSVRRAYFGISPHLWPLAVWRMLVLWSSVLVLGAFGAAYVGGADLNLVGVVLITAAYALWAALFLLIPAALVTLFDLVLVSRPEHRPAKFDARPRRTDRQSWTAWAGWAATASSIFGTAYLFVYLNAFAPDRSYQALFVDDILRFSVGGAGAGVMVAWMMNALHDNAAARSITDQLRRGAFLWAATVSGFSVVLLLLSDSALERSILPGALLAVMGAAVIPQLALTPPTDLSQIPPPQLPAAPSPSPNDPEGGWGEGARGDWESAPPPKVLGSGKARGASSAPAPHTDRSDMGGEVGLGQAGTDAADASPESQTHRGAIREGDRGRQAASNELDRILIRSEKPTRSNPDSISTPLEVVNG